MRSLKVKLLQLPDWTASPTKSFAKVLSESQFLYREASIKLRDWVYIIRGENGERQLVSVNSNCGITPLDVDGLSSVCLAHFLCVYYDTEAFERFYRWLICNPKSALRELTFNSDGSLVVEAKRTNKILDFLRVICDMLLLK
jgi:hypothetical protein